MGKPKVALYWLSSCGGCEEAVVDMAEALVEVLSAVEVVLWPVAMDFKLDGIRKLNAREIAVSFINGSVRMDEQEKMALLLREKSRIVIAQGSCAHLGGVYALSNLYSRDSVLRRSYVEAGGMDNPEGILPGDFVSGEGRPEPLSGFHDRVRALDEVIEVDYYIPGCPSTPESIRDAFKMLLTDTFPARKSVLAEKQSLCRFCPRRESFPEKISSERFRRVHQARWDSKTCFLAQEIICLGPSTRGGCGFRCIGGNMPCRGCFGPVGAGQDQGGRSVSFLASLLDTSDEQALKALARSVADPVGLFFRYALAAGILKGKKGF